MDQSLGKDIPKGIARRQFLQDNCDRAETKSYYKKFSTEKLVSQLRGFRAKVDKQVESDHNPNKGDKRVLIAQAVDSNIPPSFKLHIPIFKGEPPVTLEVETYFNADDLTCTLVSPMANDFTEDTKNTSIDKILDKIVEIAKDIAIINV